MAPKKTTAKTAGSKKATPKEKAADPEALRAAFAAFDSDGDGALSEAELVHVLTKQTKEVGGEPFGEAEAAVEAAKIIKKFDTNSDGKLQYGEFVTWLLDSSKAAKAAVPASSKAAGEELVRLLQEQSDAIFAEHDKGGKGGLKKGELAQVIKDANDEYGFLNDRTMPEFIKQAWVDAAPDGENLCRIEPFRKWYASFVEYLDGIKAKDAATAAAAADDKAAAATSLFSGDGLWTIKMKQLLDALSAAWAKGKTPLLVDATGDDQGGTTALETFYSYSGHQLLEMKKMVVEVNMKKTVTLEEALAEARRKLVLSMKQGYNLVIMCSNAAPPLKSKFTSPSALPYLLLEDNAAVASACSQDWKSVAWAKELLTDDDKIFIVHKDFQVVAMTRFSEADYAEFLAAEMPLDKMQHIKVVTD